jgi:flagellar secretion chaperone FliS
MFASATQSRFTQRQAGAYQQVGTATGVESASPHGLITMLFDGLLRAIAEARGALRSRNIPAKGAAIGRAVRIIDEGLRSSLNLAEGGDIASDLHALYGYVALRLTHANLHNDEAALEECNRLIDTLRAGWAGIASQVAAA